jgi:uncharacterized protein YPO0396
VKRLEVHRDEQQVRVDELKQSIKDNGGDHLERLAAEIKRMETLRDGRRGKADRYGQLSSRLGQPAAADAETFLAQHRHFKTLREELRSRQSELQNALTEHTVAMHQGKQEHEALSAEIDSLKRRRSNIDDRQIQIRAALCQALGLAEDEMPFVGELIQVREEDREWEGAAERLLHGFGLSLLVEDAHYKEVAAWVDRNHLRGRLVYFHVRARRESDLPEVGRDSLARKLLVRPDSPFYDWLERELARRFDVACCVTKEQFRRETRAITRTGQIKDQNGRHEKDDRYSIDDRSRYVLGWSNSAKIEVLQTKREVLEKSLAEIGSQIEAPGVCSFRRAELAGCCCRNRCSGRGA